MPAGDVRRVRAHARVRRRGRVMDTVSLVHIRIAIAIRPNRSAA